MNAKSMMNAGLLMLIFVLVETAAFAAQGERGKAEAGHTPVPIESKITIAIDNLDCYTSVGKGKFAAMSYAFGAQMPTDPASGMQSGRPIVEPLQLTRKLDDCSAALFGEVVGVGKPLANFELNYEVVDQTGKPDTLLKITMTGVSISSYAIVGNEQTMDKSGVAAPRESVQIEYAKICIEVFDQGKSQSQMCYDRLAPPE